MLLADAAFQPELRPRGTLTASVQVLVRVERATAAARQEDWHAVPPLRRREVHTLDQQGRPVVLRIIDHH